MNWPEALVLWFAILMLVTIAGKSRVRPRGRRTRHSWSVTLDRVPKPARSPATCREGHERLVFLTHEEWGDVWMCCVCGTCLTRTPRGQWAHDQRPQGERRHS